MTSKQTKANQSKKEKKPVKRPVRPVSQGPVAQLEEPDLLALQRAVANLNLASLADVLALQRRYGNRTVQRMIKGVCSEVEHERRSPTLAHQVRGNSELKEDTETAVQRERDVTNDLDSSKKGSKELTDPAENISINVHNEGEVKQAFVGPIKLRKAAAGLARLQERRDQIGRWFAWFGPVSGWKKRVQTEFEQRSNLALKKQWQKHLRYIVQYDTNNKPALYGMVAPQVEEREYLPGGEYQYYIVAKPEIKEVQDTPWYTPPEEK